MSAERIEVRRNPDGTIDEVLLYVGDRCVFHLEQMSKRSWYFGLYPKCDDGRADEHYDPDEMQQFYIWSDKRVTVRAGSDG